MVIFKKVSDISLYIKRQKSTGAKVGFIPTMGALHTGHLSLVRAAKDACGIAVCSIFVNPTQFNDAEDLKKYPVTTEADIELLLGVGCDVLFLPSRDEIYPNGAAAAATFDFGYLDTVLEGAQRPGHFKGVGQVVSRLLEIVQPDALFLGAKDFQQCKVIQSLLGKMGGSLDVVPELVVCPTLREADGLAMSSRNRRLSEPQRAVAGNIYRCLVSIQAKQGDAPFEILRKECRDILLSKGFEPEYIALADYDTLQLLDEFDSNRKMVVLMAASLGGVRLIDNMAL